MKSNTFALTSKVYGLLLLSLFLFSSAASSKTLEKNTYFSNYEQLKSFKEQYSDRKRADLQYHRLFISTVAKLDNGVYLVGDLGEVYTDPDVGALRPSIPNKEIFYGTFSGVKFDWNKQKITHARGYFAKIKSTVDLGGYNDKDLKVNWGKPIYSEINSKKAHFIIKSIIIEEATSKLNTLSKAMLKYYKLKDKVSVQTFIEQFEAVGIEDILPITRKNVGKFNDVAFFMERNKHYKSAIKILNKVIKKYPNRTVAYINLGDAYWALDQKEEAKNAYIKYVDLMKKNNKQKRIPKRILKNIETVQQLTATQVEGVISIDTNKDGINETIEFTPYDEYFSIKSNDGSSLKVSSFVTDGYSFLDSIVESEKGFNIITKGSNFNGVMSISIEYINGEYYVSSADSKASYTMGNQISVNTHCTQDINKKYVNLDLSTLTPFLLNIEEDDFNDFCTQTLSSSHKITWYEKQIKAEKVGIDDKLVKQLFTLFPISSSNASNYNNIGLYLEKTGRNRLAKLVFNAVKSNTKKAPASSSTYSKNDKGELVINGDVYPDILNNNTYLMNFMGQPALAYEGTRGASAYFTFKQNHIDCIYNSTRNTFNGFMNKNAICDLDLEIQFAIDHYSNIISKVSNKGSHFVLKRNSEGGLVADQDFIVTLFQDNKNYSIKIEYKDLNDYINAKPNVVVRDGDKVSLTSADYFILYKKSNDGYKIDQILFKSDESKHQGEKEEYKKFQVSY